MVEQRAEHTSVHARQRLALALVDPARAPAYVIPARGDGSLPYSGRGPIDYTCGACGRQLVTGSYPGVFRSLAFACRCGALNQVP